MTSEKLRLKVEKRLGTLKDEVYEMGLAKAATGSNLIGFKRGAKEDIAIRVKKEILRINKISQ